jgi:hypothetical protein
MLRELKREKIQRLFIMAIYDRGWVVQADGSKSFTYCILLHFEELLCGLLARGSRSAMPDVSC